MRRGRRLENLRIVMIALTAMFCVRAFLPVKESGRVKAAEKEPEAVLSQITWEDDQNGREMEPVVLHFAFQDGTVVEKEVPYYPSIVEKIEYRDITGDGKDEALVYRYFANTATEYTLIDIFEIENGTVSYISPETKLEELADDVWNMTMTEYFAAGGANYVFKMESYDKENGMAFADETILIVYGTDGWQICRHRSWKLRYVMQKLVYLIMEK